MAEKGSVLSLFISVTIAISLIFLVAWLHYLLIRWFWRTKRHYIYRSLKLLADASLLKRVMIVFGVSAVSPLLAFLLAKIGFDFACLSSLLGITITWHGIIIDVVLTALIASVICSIAGDLALRVLNTLPKDGE